jgi:hypothetical protein
VDNLEMWFNISDIEIPSAFPIKNYFISAKEGSQDVIDAL